MSWSSVKFKDVATIVTGSTPKKIEGNYEGNIPFVTPGDLGKLAEIDTAKISLTKAGADSARQLPASSVLVCCIGATIGKVGFSTVPVVTNQQINSLVFDKSKVFPKYAYYFCATLTPFLRDRSTSTTMPIVNKSSFSEIEIPLPYPEDPEKSLKEQKRIAAILDKADGISRKRKQAIQLADDFLRSVFLDMFGDPVTNPKGWEVKEWEDCLRIVNGKNQKKVESENGEYPICGSGGVMSKANDWLVEKNSVIIGRKGNINSPILMKERFWNVDTAFGLEPKKDILIHNYLFWFCKFFDFERLNKAVTIPSLTKADLLKVSLPLPKIEHQKEFDDIVDKVDAYLEKAFEFEGNKSFEALSQKAFKG